MPIFFISQASSPLRRRPARRPAVEPLLVQYVYPVLPNCMRAPGIDRESSRACLHPCRHIQPRNTIVTIPGIGKECRLEIAVVQRAPRIGSAARKASGDPHRKSPPARRYRSLIEYTSPPRSPAPPRNSPHRT